MTPRPSRPPTGRRRIAVFGLFAAAAVVLTVTLALGLRTETPVAAVPEAVLNRPRTSTPVPPVPTAETEPVVPPGAVPEAPSVVAAAPETVSPLVDTPPAPAPAAPRSGEAVTEVAPVEATPAPAEPIPSVGQATVPLAPTETKPTTSLRLSEILPPAITEWALSWLRRQFGLFLDQAGPSLAAMPEPQRDALFAEFLTWRRARDEQAVPPRTLPEEASRPHAP